MGLYRIHQTFAIRAPVEYVFERLTDHEAMGLWPGVSSCELIKQGSPPNGLGAVRAVKTNGLTLHEEIVRFEPPRRYDYRIVKGLPLGHHGTVMLEQQGDLVRLQWVVELWSHLPLAARGVGLVLDRGLGRALEYFVEQTEQSAPKELP